jgi:hypothetical protein
MAGRYKNNAISTGDICKCNRGNIKNLLSENGKNHTHAGVLKSPQ